MSLKLLKSTAVFGGTTMISRVMGFIRDVLVARVFGADAGTDAFFVAFKIPNFMRRLFAEGAFSQAFVPVLSEYREQRGHEDVRQLLERVSGTLGAILFLITVVGVLAAPLLIMLFAPGFVGEQDKHELASEMLRLTFPYLMFISLTALAGGVLNAYGKFAVPAFTPVFLNICLIVAALWVAPHMERPIMALAWGVLIAGIVQLLFQFPYLARMKLLVWPRWGWHDSGVRRILKLMLPAMLGVSVAQINLMFDTIIASFLVTGSVSWLYYSDRLVEFPMGVFGIALATVILPSLSQRHAQADTDSFSQTLDWALRWVLLIGVPATLGLVLLAQPILSTLFLYGEFGRHDLQMASLSLMAYSLGLMGFIFVKVLAPGYYARQDTRTPVRIAMIAMAANMGMNLLFAVPMVLLDIPGAHAGLALATAFAAFVNAGLLFLGLRKAGVYRAQPGWLPFTLRIAAAGAVMAVVLVLVAPVTAQWTAWSAGVRGMWLMGLVGAGAAAYFGMLWVSGLKLRDVLMKPRLSSTGKPEE